MPILELTYPTDALGSDEALGALAQKLTGIVLRAERAPDTEAAKYMTVVYFHEVPAARTYLAGTRAKAPPFVLRVIVPHGAISLRRLQRLIAESTDAIAQAAPIASPGAEPTRVIVIVSEVGEGYLGLDGRAVTLADLARIAAGADPDASAIQHAIPAS